MKLNQSVTAKTLVGGLLSLAAQRAKRGELVFKLLVKPKIYNIDALVDIKQTLNAVHSTVL